MNESVPDITLGFQVKGYDIDVAGIVHNSVYLLWLDDIRTAFLEKVLPVEEQVRLGYIPVLSKTEISYKRAIKFGDRPVGRMYVTLISRLRWRISCDFVVGDLVTTQAMQEGCLVDLSTGRPIQMPEPFVRYWDLKHRRIAEANYLISAGDKSGCGSDDTAESKSTLSAESTDCSESTIRIGAISGAHEAPPTSSIGRNENFIERSNNEFETLDSLDSMVCPV